MTTRPRSIRPAEVLDPNINEDIRTRFQFLPSDVLIQYDDELLSTIDPELMKLLPIDLIKSKSPNMFRNLSGGKVKGLIYRYNLGQARTTLDSMVGSIVDPFDIELNYEDQTNMRASDKAKMSFQVPIPIEGEKVIMTPMARPKVKEPKGIYNPEPPKVAKVKKTPAKAKAKVIAPEPLIYDKKAYQDNNIIYNPIDQCPTDTSMMWKYRTKLLTKLKKYDTIQADMLSRAKVSSVMLGCGYPDKITKPTDKYDTTLI
jgi:hypothetical protein